MISSSISLITN